MSTDWPGCGSEVALPGPGSAVLTVMEREAAAPALTYWPYWRSRSRPHSSFGRSCTATGPPLLATGFDRKTASEQARRGRFCCAATTCGLPIRGHNVSKTSSQYCVLVELGQREGDVEGVVGVEQDQQRVARNRRPVFVDVDVVAPQKQPQAARVTGVPGLGRHFFARRVEPHDVLDRLAANFTAVKEAAALQHGLPVPERDQRVR